MAEVIVESFELIDIPIFFALESDISNLRTDPPSSIKFMIDPELMPCGVSVISKKSLSTPSLKFYRSFSQKQYLHQCIEPDTEQFSQRLLTLL